MATWRIEDERRKMQKLLTMTAQQASMLLRTLRSPKALEPDKDGKVPESKLSNTKVRLLRRVSKSIEAGDKENRFILTMQELVDATQDEASAKMAKAKDKPAAEHVLQQVNAESGIKQRELVRVKGQSPITFGLDEGDFEAVKKDWESREWDAVDSELEAIIGGIGDAFENPQKPEEAPK